MCCLKFTHTYIIFVVGVNHSLPQDLLHMYLDCIIDKRIYKYCRFQTNFRPGADDELWLSDGEDEDENYMEDEEGEVRPPSEQRVPINESDLPDTVTILERDGCLVYLVGTAHFSKESQNDVSKVS